MEEAERVMTGYWELLLMRNAVYKLSYEFRKSIELVKKSLRLIFFSMVDEDEVKWEDDLILKN